MLPHPLLIRFINNDSILHGLDDLHDATKSIVKLKRVSWVILIKMALITRRVFFSFVETDHISCWVLALAKVNVFWSVWIELAFCHARIFGVVWFRAFPVIASKNHWIFGTADDIAYHHQWRLPKL